jgi:membrane-associated phospholipid phosphatase
MLPWLQSLDTALYRFINLKLGTPALDPFMRTLSGTAWFIPLVIAVGVGLLWKGGKRGRTFVAVLALTLGLGDSFIINPLKKLTDRDRPFLQQTDARLLVGRGNSNSMPSSHTSTWFAATLVAFAFYRRSWRVLLPLACLVAFSRVYLGAHYPGDVLAGAILGAGYASAALWLYETLWQRAVRRWFPLWWQRQPSLLNPDHIASGPKIEHTEAIVEAQFLRFSYIVIGLLLLVRLAYVSGDIIELTEDEAYQWIWSKHLALSYYSKPPMIALLQWTGTHLWGDTAFGVRFFSPIIAALLALVLVRFMAREVSARAGFFLLLIVSCTPMLAAGTILMTIDPPLVLFWTLSMIAGWRAAQPDGTTRHWLLAGLWLGLGFLSKYTAACLLGCWAIYFALSPEARRHLRKPGPWLALLIFALCTVPVILWNAQNGWITVTHVSENAKLDKAWTPTLRFFAEFTAAETALLHPIFFVAALWAGVAFWKRRQEHPLHLYLFCMGTPLFLGYWLYTLHSRVQPNWIAPAIIPMFCLMTAWWHARWREGARGINSWLAAALATGAVIVVISHDTGLVNKIAKSRLPAKFDPTSRAQGHEHASELVAKARHRLLAEGTETFIIAGHYGLTSLLTFYTPEARASLPESPLIYPRTTSRPKNQFWFWPEYRYPHFRKGQNAIYVSEAKDTEQIPTEVAGQFTSVKDLGLVNVRGSKRTVRKLQLWECRGLR